MRVRTTAAHKIIIMVAINRKRTANAAFPLAGAPADSRVYVPSPPPLSLSFRRGISAFTSSAYPSYRPSVPPDRRVRNDAKDEGREWRRALRARARSQPSAAGLYGTISACPRALWCCSSGLARASCLPLARGNLRCSGRRFQKKKKKSTFRTKSASRARARKMPISPTLAADFQQAGGRHAPSQLNLRGGGDHGSVRFSNKLRRKIRPGGKRSSNVVIW